MKKLIVIVCMVTMVMGLALVASAAALDAVWNVNIKIGNSTLAKGYTFNAGTTATSVDAFVGGEDGELPPPSSGKDAVSIFGTDTAGKSLIADKRGAITAGELIVWHITIAKQESYADPNIYLRAWNATGTSNDIDDDAAFPVKLYNVTGGTKTLLWEFLPTVNGSSTSTAAGSKLDIVLGSSANTYNLQLEAGVVPEPGSIVAMLSGLVGLVGYGVRRRK